MGTHPRHRHDRGAPALVRHRPRAPTNWCSRAAMSSIRATPSAPSATSASPAAALPRWPRHPGLPGQAGHRRHGTLRHARPDRHPRARLSRRAARHVFGRRPQRDARRFSRCAIASRRWPTLAAADGVASTTSSARHRSLHHARHGVPQHRGRRHARGRPRTEPRGHGRARHGDRAEEQGRVVGVKSAHFNGPEWTPYNRAVEAGRMADIPVMVDFGGNVRAGRTIMALVTEHFRPGDIFTHMYGGVRGEQDPRRRGRAQH